MTESKICTCPSGNGSLRHPCPAHPESVELTGVAAKLTFINGRPAMCGCQVEYSSGGGEYSDVIYVTLCAKHSGSAILDLVATNRIALTPEYEGQWHADLYLDREIPLAKAEGATPAEAVLALMSAERIDPEQESVEQAGGDERAGLRAAAKWHREQRNAFEAEAEMHRQRYENTNRPDSLTAEAEHHRRLWETASAMAANHLDYAAGFEEMARAALAQPSPAQAEKAEVERPEVVARVVHSNPVVLDHCGPLNANDELMTVAQHAASVARWAEMFNRVEQERDAGLAEVERLTRDRDDCLKARLHYATQLGEALARVAELERGKVYVEARRCDECQHGGINDSATGVAACHECDWAGPEPEEDKCPGCQRENCMAAACPQCGARYVLVASEEIAAPVAQAQQLHDLDKQCRDDVARALGLRPNEERGFAWSYLLASIKSCVKAAQAQHSVPEGWMLVECGIWTQEQVDEMQRTVARFRSSEFVDDRALAMAVADAGQCKAPEISLAELLAAAPGKEVGHE